MSDGTHVMWMRGGTSKGGYFLKEDLPAETAARDALRTALERAIKLKPGSATRPFFGVAPEIVDAEGKVLSGATTGMRDAPLYVTVNRDMTYSGGSPDKILAARS